MKYILIKEDKEKIWKIKTKLKIKILMMIEMLHLYKTEIFKNQ
jgi:hypothetical protein